MLCGLCFLYKVEKDEGSSRADEEVEQHESDSAQSSRPHPRTDINRLSQAVSDKSNDSGSASDTGKLSKIQRDISPYWNFHA